MPLTWTKLQPLLYLSEEGPTSLMFPIHQQSWFSQSRESRTQSGNISNLSIFTSFIIIWSFSSQHDNRPHILMQSHQFDAIISSTLLQSSLGNSFIKYCLYQVRLHHAQSSPCRVSCQKSSVFPTVYGLFRGLHQGRWKPAMIVPPNQFSISLKQGNGCVSIAACTGRSWSFPLAKSPWVIQVRWSLWENHPGRVNTPWTLGKALGE